MITTFTLDGFTLLPCSCGATSAQFVDEEREYLNGNNPAYDPNAGKTTRERYVVLQCLTCGMGLGGRDSSHEDKCGRVDVWNTSFMLGRDPLVGPFLPSADGTLSAELVHLDMLDTHTTNAFGAFMMFGPTPEKAGPILRYFKAKAALEDQLGHARSDMPLTPEHLEQRAAMIEGLEEFIRTGDFKTAVLARIQKWVTP